MKIEHVRILCAIVEDVLHLQSGEVFSTFANKKHPGKIVAIGRMFVVSCLKNLYNLSIKEVSLAVGLTGQMVTYMLRTLNTAMMEDEFVKQKLIEYFNRVYETEGIKKNSAELVRNVLEKWDYKSRRKARIKEISMQSVGESVLPTQLHQMDGESCKNTHAI